MNGFLSENIKITVEAPAASATTPVNSSILDMQGWLGVIWIVRLGTPGATNNIKAQQGQVSTLSDAADLEGSLVNSATKNVHVLDLQRTSERYARCVVTRGALTTVDSLVAIQYGGRARGMAQAATIEIEKHIDKAEGAA